MIEDMVKDITLDYLQNSKLGDKLDVALRAYEKAEEAVNAFVHDESDNSVKIMRIGTMLTFAIISKLKSKRSFKDFDEKDWAEIAESVVQYAIIEADERYSMRIFCMYADYIEASVGLLRKANCPEEKCTAIQALSDEIRSLTEDFQAEKMLEVDYTEQCLWILLEAMIKLLTAFGGTFMSEEAAEFVESVSMFAFEYGRYRLYKQELELLDLYLTHQYELDDELEQKLAEYKQALGHEQREFEILVEDAFSKDFSKRLKASVDVARNVGVSDDEILIGLEMIDEFFN